MNRYNFLDKRKYGIWCIVTVKGQIYMLKEAIISFYTYYNIDVPGLPTMGGRGLEAAISKGHIGLFLTKSAEY